MNRSWNANEVEWAERVPDQAYGVTANIAAHYTVPARPATDRNPGVGAKKHFSCAFVYGPGAGTVMKTDSLTEKRVALVLLARPDVTSLENQVAFGWVARDGTKHTHFFDFLVTMADGSRVAIMVKYDDKLGQEEFRDEISKIAAQVPPEFADRVTLMTEKHLDPVDIFNSTLFNAVRFPDDEADAAMRQTIGRLNGAARIGDLIAHTGLGGRGFRSIARLISSRELALQGRVRVTYDSLVMRGAA
ncbi:MAG: hypothetical protein CMP09_01760 [Yangia sp.]|nr:hypothetical protein [Salipiger sp.]